MSLIPEDKVTNQDISEWYTVQKQLADLKLKESAMRSRIVRCLFTVPKEGTNNHSLGDGYVLKAVHSITRTIDVACLTALQQNLIDNGIKVDSIIKKTPELVKSEYNKLDDQDKHLFDQVLIIKPGSTSLKIEFSKSEAKKNATQVGAVDAHLAYQE